MANEHSNNVHPGHEASDLDDGVPSVSATSPSAGLEDPDTRRGHESTLAGADSTSSSAPEIQGPGRVSSVQPQPSSHMWNTREGRIAGYRRMIETNHRPEQRANFEALIRYYEDGGKVPEGEEEVWAFDGQASFGIRFYTKLEQIPDGWFHKVRYCDTSKWHQIHHIPKPSNYMITDTQGRVTL